MSSIMKWLGSFQVELLGHEAPYSSVRSGFWMAMSGAAEFDVYSEYG